MNCSNSLYLILKQLFLLQILHLLKELLILYGGSVKPENVKGYLNQNNVDGALVGGASLKIDSFTAMVKNLAE